MDFEGRGFGAGDVVRRHPEVAGRVDVDGAEDGQLRCSRPLTPHLSQSIHLRRGGVFEVRENDLDDAIQVGVEHRVGDVTGGHVAPDDLLDGAVERGNQPHRVGFRVDDGEMPRRSPELGHVAEDIAPVRIAAIVPPTHFRLTTRNPQKRCGRTVGHVKGHNPFVGPANNARGHSVAKVDVPQGQATSHDRYRLVRNRSGGLPAGEGQRGGEGPRQATVRAEDLHA